MNPPSIVLVGQGRWTHSLAEGLKDAGLEVQYVAFESGADIIRATWELRRLSKATLVVRIGFRPGAKTWRGLAFDAALRVLARPRTTVACYWIGTDVMQFADEVARRAPVGAWRSPASAVDYHLAGSEPLRDELAESGVNAEVAPFPWRTITPPEVLPPIPTTFSVATYVPDHRADFYGGPHILEAARRLPHVRFEVMGGAGTWSNDPPTNVSFLGWISDPADLYARSSCVLRLAMHDSIGGTAVEGLMFGRPVIYTGELPYSDKIDLSADDVVDAIQRLLGRSVGGSLQPNEAAAAWARVEFDASRRFKELASRLEQMNMGGSQGNPRLTYLTLQATSEGQAAHAHVHEIVKGLAQNGWSVRLIQPRYDQADPGHVSRLLEFARIQLLAGRGLRRSDAFYIRAHFAAYPAALLARILRIPVVQEINGTRTEALVTWPSLLRFRKVVEWLDRKQARMAEALIAVTPQLLEWASRDAGVTGISLIPNGADVDLFRPNLPVPDGLPRKYAIFFGALAPWQGISVAIEATMSQSWPRDVSLIIVGDGMLRPYVEQCADGQRVIYLGRRPYKDMPALVSNSLASLVPIVVVDDHGNATSTDKGGGIFHSPLKLYESMACGVPVVVSSLAGISETVTAAGCGLLVEPGNPDAIARAVGLLDENRPLAQRMGTLARKSAVDEHSWRARADSTNAILRSVIRVGRRAR